MRKTTLMTTIAAAGIALAACSTSSPSTTAATTLVARAASTPASSAAPAGSNVVVKATKTTLGAILVDAGGRTLYGFTNDTEARSTCSGTCASAWPPVIVNQDWTVAPGLDSGVFSTIKRDDGTEQLMAGKWPLYTFSGDASAGDLNGQGSGNVWFVVDTKATLAKAAVNDASTASSTPATTVVAPAAGGAGAGYGAATTKAPAASTPATTAAAAAAIAKTARTELGTIVVDAKGMTLYGFTKDTDGTSTCNGACATAWPPVLVTSDIAVEGLDKSLFSVIDRADGSKQLKMGKWPLYRFSGDTAAGDTDGQASGGSWFVIGADAKLIK
jgi:predicted lipoprotein with Yx(FWY)xxD motif